MSIFQDIPISKRGIMHLFKDKGAHWYDSVTGEPCHSVVMKNGKSRPTNLGDAKKRILFPSVTKITAIKKKSRLETWKVAEAIRASYKVPHIEGETEEEFAERVILFMDEEQAKAPGFGSEIHKLGEQINLGIPINKISEIYPYIRGYEAWFKENITKVYFVERALIHRKYGYAGTCDLYARHKEHGDIVIDLKSQKDKQKQVFYNDWALQVAAYRQCIIESNNEGGLLPFPQCLGSVIINSEVPSEIEFKEWGCPGDHFDAFLNCLALWKYDNKYYPTGKLNKNI